MQDKPTVPEISIVIPVFNQGRFLKETFHTIREEFSDVGVEIVLVDDGSTKDQEFLEGADNLIQLETNQGKGAAVKAGMLEAKGKVVLYTDADLSYSPDFLKKLYLAVAGGGFDAAVGVRNSTQADSSARSFGSRFLRWLTKRWVLKRNIDTQCGAKAFSLTTAKAVFEKVEVKRFAFDVEVFCALEKMGAKVLEEPTIFEARPGSSVNVIRDGLVFVRDLRAIRKRLKAGVYG